MMELNQDRRDFLLGYCKLTELADDPEVLATLPALEARAVEYLEAAGIREPDPDAPRRASFDLLVGYLVLNAWERRETIVIGGAVVENPSFRQLLNQMKLTEV